MTTTTTPERWIVRFMVTGFLLAATARADITLSNRVVVTPRHQFTVDDTGLPAQLEVRALTNDIPLAWRASKERPANLLRRIGRGPQLAAPVRLEAVIDTVTAGAKTDAPAELGKTDTGIEAAGTWQAGALKGRLRIRYAEDGSLTGEIAFDPKGLALERLDLVIEVSGPVDTAISGNPAEAVAGPPLPANYGSLDSKPGMLWRDGASPVGDGSLHTGRLAHFFLGNGDWGLTWLAHAADGSLIGGPAASMSVERKSEGIVIWRIALVNRPAKAGEQTIGFTLLTHPARLREPGQRLLQWQPWLDQTITPALSAADRAAFGGSNLLVRAEAGSVYETAATRAVLEGIAGGAASDANATLADRFPLGLFRYLSASHTAVSAQLRPNAAALTSAGASPGSDRMALGRALLHDIGVDISGLARRMEAANVLRALDAFGYFEDDGQTEFLPYWRTEGIFQFGETFEGDAGFAVTAESPTARTKVSAFIRPTEVVVVDKKAVVRRKTLFVLVNEGTNAVRENLYVWNPNYVFGGPNRLQAEQIYSQLDFSGIAPDGDWQRNRVERTLPERVKSRTGRATGLSISNGQVSRHHMSELMDVESGGIVRLAEGEVQFAKKFYGDMLVKNGFQLFGPVYIPPRGMRLLFGEGIVDLPHGVAGRVVDQKTGKPLSVPVHLVLNGEVNPSDTLDSLKSGKHKIATVQSDAEGYFIYPGFEKGVILAEVDGKLFSPPPQVRIRNDGTVVGREEASAAEAEGGDSRASTSLYQNWSNPNPGSAGKWVDVLIEVGSPGRARDTDAGR
ncbi:MAG: hypothetical protein FJ222_02705 [Lentisphaerae bacterium]|nr:hypothetical protein [Lentisphaerota bacterium]